MRVDRGRRKVTWGSGRVPIKGLPSVFDKETKRLSGPQTVMDQRSRPLILQRNYGAFLYRDFDGHHRLAGGVVGSYKQRQNSNKEICVEGVACSEGGRELKNIKRMGMLTFFCIECPINCGDCTMV